MGESIQCYQCGTRMTLEELVKNHDDCAECGATHTLSDVAKALELNTRAKVSQGGEAVSPVVWRAGVNGEWVYGSREYVQRERDEFEADEKEDPDFQHEEAEPLMTVAQHQRILDAATHPADQVEDDLTMVKVSRELLERALKADASIGANAIQLADGWNAMAELRALLAKPCSR